MKRNYLKPENCNKVQCKTCIFRNDGNQVIISPERMAEIKRYLVGESSHICHTTNLTCYGGLEWQAQIFYGMGLIPEPTVESFLKTANEFLKLK